MPTHGPVRSLRREEAERRAALLDVVSYDVALDLAGGDDPRVATFGSRATIVLESAGGHTFLDVRPEELLGASLDGARLDPGALDGGRLPLDLPPGRHEVVVDTRMRYRNDGEGLHRSVDPADGRAYLYVMSFMDAAPTVFGCFDQPDLKAPYRVTVRAPGGWVVRGNGRAERMGDDGPLATWELTATPPLSTYLVTLVAGPYHLLEAEHGGIALGLSARRSLAGSLDLEADELFTLTGQCFDELHRLLGIRYAFGDYHQAFVPDFNAGAMENPGCVTFRDQMVFDSRVTRAARVDRATTIAHEMAHQWFGDLVTPRWWDDLWLNESFAEYLGTRVTADATRYADAWAHQAASRRQWGLTADQRPSTHPVASSSNGAEDAAAALQDFDGISYAKGSAVLKQLVARVGDDVFLGGVVDHLTRHRFGNATMADLVASWERAGAGDLDGFVADWLRTPGLDTLRVDRPAGGVRRDPPSGPGAGTVRAHALSLAVLDGARWRRHDVAVGDGLTPLPQGVAADAAVVLDPDEQTWAASCADAVTLRALPDLLPGLPTDDPALTAAVWNNVRSAYRLALLEPAAVVDAVVAAPPLTDLGDARAGVAPWVVAAVLPAAPDGSTARVHASLLVLLEDAGPGGDQQLRCARGVVHTAEDPGLLRDWLAGSPPDGLVLDDDLRWRLQVRLAALGATDRAALDEAFAAHPSSTARVEHTRAVASLPDAAAKEWAWSRFTSGDEHGGHEVEAAGLGLWCTGQETLTASFVARYVEDLPTTARQRSGWGLARAASAFFPRSQVDQGTLDAVAPLAAAPALPGAVRRQVVDRADDLARALAVRRAFTAPVGAAS